MDQQSTPRPSHRSQHHHHHHHHHHYMHAPMTNNVLTADTVMGIFTGVTLSASMAMCFSVAVLPVDIEHVICATLLSLGYVLLPTMAVMLLLRALRSGPHANSSFPVLGSPLSRLLGLSAMSVVWSIDANTRLFSGSPDEPPQQCAVCLDDVTGGQSCRELRCHHVFHKSCADAWLLVAQKNCCPLCLTRVCPDRDANMDPIPELRFQSGKCKVDCKFS